MCILCVDHHRKAGPLLADVIDDMVGSTGKSAVVDTVWGLYRKRGERGATLRVVGRDVDERELSLEFHPATGCWQMAEDARQVASKSAQGRVLDALRALGEAGATAVAKKAGVARSTAHKHLERLCESDEAERRTVVRGGNANVLYSVKGLQPPLV